MVSPVNNSNATHGSQRPGGDWGWGKLIARICKAVSRIFFSASRPQVNDSPTTINRLTFASIQPETLEEVNKEVDEISNKQKPEFARNFKSIEDRFIWEDTETDEGVDKICKVIDEMEKLLEGMSKDGELNIFNKLRLGVLVSNLSRLVPLCRKGLRGEKCKKAIGFLNQIKQNMSCDPQFGKSFADDFVFNQLSLTGNKTMTLDNFTKHKIDFNKALLQNKEALEKIQKAEKNPYEKIKEASDLIYQTMNSE